MDEAGKIAVSAIIPAFNEEQTIGETIEKTVDYFKKENIDYEVIVVDDGSQDKTLEKVRKICAIQDNIRILINSKNKGKGFAVKKGVLQAKGESILFFDADYSTPIEEYRKFRIWLNKSYPVVIGSRKIDAAEVGIHQHFLRESMGKVFTMLSNLLITSNLSDITCGFKCFQRQAAQDIFKRQRLNRWSFDSEILFIAQKRGYRIKEVPVHWNNMPRTKVNLFKDTITSFWELLKIRFYDFRGFYK